jgi:hypothetical protein
LGESVVAKRKLAIIGIGLVLVADAFALASAVLLQNVWFMMLALVVTAFGVYAFYIRRIHKRRPRYPLVPPEGRPDMYLPRTDIPRPVVEDFRKIEEKKQKFAKLKKTIRRVGNPKKK